MEDWEKEMYDDDHPSVEFAGVIFAFAILIVGIAIGFAVGRFW